MDPFHRANSDEMCPYKHSPEKGKKMVMPECNACEREFEPDRLTIHCTKCDRYWCSETSCWTDFCSESWPADEKQRHFFVCEREASGAFAVDGCDECE